MRKWVSTFVVLAGLAFAAPALADSPADVYSDFADDGVLSCNHSRSALGRALNDASLYQYGDPLTFMQMKLAIRKQLAGSCRRSTGSGRANGTAAAVPIDSSLSVGGSTEPTKPKARKRPGASGSIQLAPPAATSEKSTAASNEEQSGGMILLGIIRLLRTLGSGGWAARRALGGE